MAASRTGGNVLKRLMRKNQLLELKLNGLRRGNTNRLEEIHIVVNKIQELLVEYKELQEENQRLTERLDAIKQQRSWRRFLCCFGVTGNAVEEEEDQGQEKIVDEQEEVNVLPEQEEDQQPKKNLSLFHLALDMKRKLEEEIQEEKREGEVLIKKKEFLMKIIELQKAEKLNLENKNMELKVWVAYEDQSFICKFFRRYVTCRGPRETSE